MKSTFCDHMIPHEICYLTPDDIMGNNQNFEYIISICSLLNIDLPNIAIGNIVLFYDPNTGETSERIATTWVPGELPGLDGPLVYIGIQYPNGDPPRDTTLIMGAIAHELRHIWQQKYFREDYSEIATGFFESLYSPAEIDADAFAFVVLSGWSGNSIDGTGKRICNIEYEMFPDAFSRRVIRAKEILDDIKPKKKTLCDRILMFFKRK